MRTVKTIDDDLVQDLLTNHVRHLVQFNRDAGWALKIDGFWQRVSKTRLKREMRAMGLPAFDSMFVRGAAAMNAWTLIDSPSEPEYPGGRVWNVGAASKG
jgi:hypothetical protein